MIHEHCSLRQAFRGVNSFLILVFVLVFLDLSFVKISFSENLIESGWGLVLLLVLPLKIFVGGGIYGTLISFVSGEEIFLTVKKFISNAREFWIINLLFSFLLPFLIHFVVFAIFLEQNISFSLVAAYSYMASLCLVVLFIVRKKYLLPHNIPVKRITVGIRTFTRLCALYLANLFVFYLPQFVQIEVSILSKIIIFISKYIHCVTFVYLTSLILVQYPEIKKKLIRRKELFLISPLTGNVIATLTFFPFFRSGPPIFVILRALTPASYKVREFNRVVWQKRYYESDKLVAITCSANSSLAAYKIAKEFKKKGSKVIMGGPHVSALPEEALEYCDSVVICDAEGVWEEVLRDYENNSLKKKYYGVASEVSLHKVHQELLRSSSGRIGAFIEPIRGCKYNCDFCVVPFVCGGIVREKPIKEVVELIEKIKHVQRKVMFISDNIYARPVYAKDLFRALKPLNIKWSSFCTIDIAKDEEALRLAKESGCGTLTIGYEIGADCPEKHKGGKFVLAEEYMRYTKKIKAHGITVKGSFIVGFESDTLRSLFKKWKFCFLLRPFCTAAGVLTPYPGTKLYFDMVQKRRLINCNWQNYSSLKLVFEHKKLDFWILPATVTCDIFFKLLIMTTSPVGLTLLVLAMLCIFCLRGIVVWVQIIILSLLMA